MRHYVVVSYDISEPRRWRKVYKLMKGHGEHVQYSVFICQLSDTQETLLKAKLDEVVHSQEDQVMFIRIGPVNKQQLQRQISTVGRDYVPLDLAKLFF